MSPRLSLRNLVYFALFLFLLAGCSSVSRPEGVDPIYATDFSDRTWEIGEYGTGRVGYVDGEYFVTQFGGADFMWGQAYRSNFTDVDIWVNAQQVSGPGNDNTGYGVMCRVGYSSATDQLTGYWFGIGADGYYSIHKFSSTEIITLVDWTSSSAIKEGNGRVNELRVVCQGSNLTFYVNGMMVAETTDSSYSFGDIGLGGVSFESDSAEFRFDDLEVYQP
ncbi:MAG: hypothetical protein PVF49_00735 [Anaerolineales bacterium]